MLLGLPAPYKWISTLHVPLLVQPDGPMLVMRMCKLTQNRQKIQNTDYLVTVLLSMLLGLPAPYKWISTLHVPLLVQPDGPMLVMRMCKLTTIPGVRCNYLPFIIS